MLQYSMLKTFLQQTKKRINLTSLKYLRNQRSRFEKINKWGVDCINVLQPFIVGGKNIRGSMLLLSAEMFGYRNPNLLLPLASAIELIHSSLLIHDDIMDEDLQRRGMKSIYARYLAMGEEMKLKNPYIFSISNAMCVGDTGFFLTIQQIAESDIPHKSEILQLFSSEMAYVGIAQMEDVYQGHSIDNPSIKDILNTYEYKTARYTFSLPFVLGGIIASQPKPVLNMVRELGLHLGLIFQIKDDELGLMSETEIGKPVGSDIKENKKTIIRHYLYKKSDAGQKDYCDSVFGKSSISPHDIETIRAMVKQLGILKEIDSIIDSHKKKAQKLIVRLRISDTHKQILRELLKYMITRNI